MKINGLIERLIYALIIVLSLVALWLVANTPASLLNARVVYQGF
jgi:hypothetical protein